MASLLPLTVDKAVVLVHAFLMLWTLAMCPLSTHPTLMALDGPSPGLSSVTIPP